MRIDIVVWLRDMDTYGGTYRETTSLQGPKLQSAWNKNIVVSKKKSLRTYFLSSNDDDDDDSFAVMEVKSLTNHWACRALFKRCGKYFWDRFNIL